MDIQNASQRREVPGAVGRQTADPQQGGAQFSGALGQVDDQATGGGVDGAESGSGQEATLSPESDAELSQKELRQKRLERFGSYTAYSLWRKTPAMALGIVTPKSEEVFAEHGLLDYWHTEKAHWQGQVAAMSEEEREATGTRLLDEEQAAVAPAEETPAEVAAVSEEAGVNLPPTNGPETSAHAAVQTSSQHSTIMPPMATDADAASPPVEPADDTSVSEQLAATTAKETLEDEKAVAAAAAVEEADGVPPVVSAAQSVEQPKSQEQLRQERLERFGSYTAYSLWRKTPAMALGIVTPKSEEYFAEHGLLDYWHTEKAHWQGLVAGMSEAERTATGTSLLDEEQTVAAVTQDDPVEAAVSQESAVATAPAEEPDSAEEAAQTLTPEVSAHAAVTEPVLASPQPEPEDTASDPEQTASAAVETQSVESQDPPAVAQEATEAVEAPEQTAPVVSEAQPVQEAKSQVELRQERLERFGSYTAYSLWRKIPAMALGIVQPKSEDYFAEHGLLDYWHTERDHWQGKVAEMSEAERAATGTTLLESTPVQANEEPEPVAEAASDSPVSPAASTDAVESASATVSEEPVASDDPPPPAETDALAETDVPPAPVSVVQEVEEAKTQEELRQERLERFGSYTAYSLWRKIPAMALGIVQAKSEDYFAEHGLLEYWQTEKKHWQGQVAAMTEAERIATGTSLLDES